MNTMNENKLQLLSDLMDGQPEGEAIITTVANDQGLSEKWERYHVIGDALRNNTEAFGSTMLADKVREALQDDDVIIFAPNNIKKPSVWSKKPLRMAASVAVVAVAGAVAMTQFSSNDAVNIAPVTVASMPTHTVVKNGHEIKRLTPRRKVNNYLAQHGAAALTQGDASVPLHLRVVGYPK